MLFIIICIIIVVIAIFCSDDTNTSTRSDNTNRTNTNTNRTNTNTNRTNINCPYCNSLYYINEDGDYFCKDCNNLFRYRDGRVYRENERLPILTEKVCELFSVLSKADGVITKEEVKLIRELLVDFMQLENREMNMATDILNKSKGKSYFSSIVSNIDTIVDDYESDEDDAYVLREGILTCCIIISYCDGEPSYNQNKILDDIVSIFGIPATTYMNLIDKFCDAYDNDNKDDYYKILGVSRNASKEEIKEAYRKLTRLYHPDVYSSKDLPPEIIKEFEEKLAKINEAYEALK